MINTIHKALFRPERGWDPVPDDHAKSYAQLAWDKLLDERIVDWVESRSGTLAGKKVLDLGGGPGEYSVAFARRGANVTWHDVSARYLSIARQKAADARVTVTFSLGYLEDAKRFGPGQFDVVFCRGCWFYSIADRPFARVVYDLIKQGGLGFVNTDVCTCAPSSLLRRLQRLMYEHCGYKIGHPMPPPELVPGLLRRFPVEDFETRMVESNKVEVLFRKPADLTAVSAKK